MTGRALNRTTPSRLFVFRMMKAVRNQKHRSVRCPDTPRLDGRLAVITGGNSGIGLETCRGLLERGAEVIMASRNEQRAEQACGRLKDELGADSPISFVKLDLGDLNSVAAAAAELQTRLGDRSIDILVANAGVWLRTHATSPQGHELSFATNVLGHHLLIRLLLERLMRVVILTGDIYCLTSACTPDYRYRTRLGAMLAYCRSKLGDLRLATELQERHPELRVMAVHPGVVDSNLGQSRGSEKKKSGGGPMIDCEGGAQMSLLCATADDLVPGGYYHNTCGLMELRPSDPARKRRASRALWETCERLCREWL